jgi:hypothetical protein
MIGLRIKRQPGFEEMARILGDRIHSIGEG